MDQLLAALRGIGESTRLRLLSLCAQGDLTVTDMTQILGQSQPRISRHLKVMCDAGLLDRFPEGAWVFYRMATHGAGADLARAITRLLPPQDPVLALDSDRLSAIKAARAQAAEAYFRDKAAQWDEIRSFHGDGAEIERLLVALLTDRPIRSLLDIGTGTGRMLSLLAPYVEEAVGVDSSRDMLAVARVALEKEGLRHCSVRQADMYHLPFPAPSFDLAIIHQVLHFAESPAAVVAEAARSLVPSGRLVIVDFAPHHLESLRTECNHRRLGFSTDEVSQWCRQAGLEQVRARDVPGQPLTVTIWLAERGALSERLNRE